MIAEIKATGVLVGAFIAAASATGATLAAVQQAMTNLSLATVVDLLMTILLMIIAGLASIVLKVAREQANSFKEKQKSDDTQFDEINKALGRITQQLWGVDGRNGHAHELRNLAKSFRRIERYLIRLDGRVQRLEERNGIATGEQEKFTPADDLEDD